MIESDVHLYFTHLPLVFMYSVHVSEQHGIYTLHCIVQCSAYTTQYLKSYTRVCSVKAKKFMILVLSVNMCSLAKLDNFPITRHVQ